MVARPSVVTTCSCHYLPCSANTWRRVASDGNKSYLKQECRLTINPIAPSESLVEHQMIMLFVRTHQRTRRALKLIIISVNQEVYLLVLQFNEGRRINHVSVSDVGVDTFLGRIYRPSVIFCIPLSSHVSQFHRYHLCPSGVITIVVITYHSIS